MLATSLTAALVGVEAQLVRVEADTASGFPKFTMVGLPDSAVKESEGRIRAALRNCGYGFKWDRRIIVNFAPAGVRKVGSSYDLATAMGLLASDGALAGPRLGSMLLVGELALDGAVRPVSGVLPMMLMARSLGLAHALVPPANAAEAALVPGIAVHPVATLVDAVQLAGSDPMRSPPPPPSPSPTASGVQPDLADVRGQPLARRGLEIAAAGGHNVLFVGPPGSGKTMLARRLAGILPPLTAEEALETTAIHSAAGAPIGGLMAARPFRSPHHTASDVALVGGSSMPRPGEISLAHNGVLFLDELPEFNRRALEALRQPLEEGVIHISRARGTLRLPARFQLVAAMNPCPCGGASARGQCRCTPTQIATYQGRISGPLLDRIDLHVDVCPVAWDDLDGPPGEPSALVAARVREARAGQAGRSGSNERLSGLALRQAAGLGTEALALLKSAMTSFGLSARAHDRLLRVARTIADLGHCARVEPAHLAEALNYRRCDRDTKL